MSFSIGELFGRIRIGDEASTTIDKVEGKLAAFAAAADAAFMAAAASGIDFASKMEQAQVGFSTMLGSAEKAQTMLEDLQAFAAHTPFEMEGLLDSSKQLMAMGFAGDDILPIMSRVGDAVAALGGGAPLIQRVTLALGQMRAKGTVSAGEIRQLAEAGIPAWEAIAQKIGVSVPEAMKLAEARAIDAATGINAVLESMGAKFGGMMEAQAKTFAGVTSTFKDTVRANLGDVFTPVMTQIQTVLAAFNALDPAVQTAIVRFATLGVGLVAFASTMVTVTAAVQALGPAMLVAARAAVPMILGWAQVALAIGAAIVLIGAVHKAWSSNLGGMKDGLTDLWDATKDAIGWLFEGWDLYFTWWRNQYLRLAEAIGLLSSAQAEGLRMGTAFGDLGSFLDTLGASVQSVVVDPIVSSFLEGVDVIASLLPKALTDAWKSVDFGGISVPGLADGGGGGAAQGAAFTGLTIDLSELPAADALDETLLELDAAFARTIRSMALSSAALATVPQGVQDVAASAQAGAQAAAAAGMSAALGAATFGIATLISQSDQFAQAKQVLGDAFQELSNAFGAFIGAMMPVYETVAELTSILADGIAPIFMALGLIFSTVLEPALRALEPAVKAVGAVLKAVGWVMLAIGLAIGSAWNAILDMILWVLDVLPGKWKKATASLENLKIDTEGISDAMSGLYGATEATADALEETTKRAENLGATADAVAQSLRNVPMGFKLAMQEFTSTDAKHTSALIPGFADGGIVTRPTLALIGEGGEREYVIPESKMGRFGGGGGGIQIGSVTVIANNPRQFVRELERSTERRNMSRTGMRATVAPKFLGR